MLIEPFGRQHIEDAARLATQRFVALRRLAPSMPSRWEAFGPMAERLAPLSEELPGCVAIQGRELVGYLCAFELADFRGSRTALSVEYSHGARADNSRRIHEALYAAASGEWAAAGIGAHLLVALAHDREALEAWRWLGFGMLAVDGLRDLTPPRVSPLSLPVEIRRATSEDLEDVAMLQAALNRHLASPPTFLYRQDTDDRPMLASWLGDARNALWLAYTQGRAVAYMRQGPANADASEIIGDPGTTSLTGAFTRPEFRGQGIGAALLDRVLAWGRERGYVRCAVDYEPMNTPAERFWGRHFQPVSIGLIRHLSDHFVDSSRASVWAVQS